MGAGYDLTFDTPEMVAVGKGEAEYFHTYGND